MIFSILSVRGRPYGRPFLMDGFGRDGKTEDEIVFMRQCARGNPLRFYNSALWEKTRDAVLEMDHHECQDCKAKGVYTQAECVHHNYFFKLYPHWGVSVWVDVGGEKKRNLVSLCHACHETRHGHRQKEEKRPLTVERWD